MEIDQILFAISMMIIAVFAVIALLISNLLLIWYALRWQQCLIFLKSVLNTPLFHSRIRFAMLSIGVYQIILIGWLVYSILSHKL